MHICEFCFHAANLILVEFEKLGLLKDKHAERRHLMGVKL